MTGLEKIVGKINAEANENFVNTTEQAKQIAAGILAKTRQEANEEAAKIIVEAEKQAKLKETIAKSMSESITRNRDLAVKNAILNDVIAASFEKISKMNTKKYFALIYKICLKNIQSGECVMHFGQRDLDRLPRDFEDEINKEVFKTSTVFISKEPIKIDGGFILAYDDFEIDCTFKSILDQSKDELIDILCPILFD